MNSRSPDLVEIQNAIDAEIAEYPDAYRFIVNNVAREGSIWKVFVDLDEGARYGLDEGLEGATAWWPGSPPGRADVLSVIPEDLQVNLRFAPTPPVEGQAIFLYPPKYLHPLKTRWDDERSAEASLAWLRRICDANRFSDEHASKCHSATCLRQRQREAFRLTGWDAGFLWGPPGTGKTHTLGELLAEFLAARPRARILLLSTTNTAVDQAIVSVDKALERLSVHDPNYEALRSRCARIGNHFVASNYGDRRHLLPVKDESLVKHLSKLEAERPDPSEVAAYATWKRQVEAVRASIRAQSADVLRRVRLAALTTTRALFTFDEINSLAPYDLIVFDEASQVPILVAAALTCVAARALFAGDPEQLAPIVRSERDDCLRWFGRSMFAYKESTPSAVCQLNEQSRMAAPICRIVSDVFYKGDLRVASDCEADPLWLGDRVTPSVPLIGSVRTCVQSVESMGRWSPQFGGMIREESAEFVTKLAAEIAARQSPDDVLLLTPFRAQRALIRSLLRKLDLRIRVNTVHRAQGSERHTVIFDPVDGSNPFLQTADAKRLINVAISRAQARLVLALGASDLQNPTLRQIAEVIGFSCRTRELLNAVPIEHVLRDPGFPKNALNQVVSIAETVGRIESVSDDELKLVDAASGRIKKYKLAVLRRRPLPQLHQASPRSHATAKPKVLRAPRPHQNRSQRTPSGSPLGRIPAAVLRATVQPLVAAPPSPRKTSVTPTIGAAPAKAERATRMRGKVTAIRPGSGTIAADDGRVYDFAYVNLGPELKLRGVEEGEIVGFTPGPPRAGVPSAHGVVPWRE